MFVEKISMTDITSFCTQGNLYKSSSFFRTEIDNELVIFFSYIELLTSYQHSLQIRDFSINGIEDEDYLKFMYYKFGEEYKTEYLKYKRKIFDK